MLSLPETWFSSDSGEVVLESGVLLEVRLTVVEVGLDVVVGTGQSVNEAWFCCKGQMKVFILYKPKLLPVNIISMNFKIVMNLLPL